MNLNQARLRTLLNTNGPRLKPFTFIVDVSLGKGLTQCLKKYGLNAEDHTDHFSAAATDVEWLERLGKIQKFRSKKRYVLVSKDSQIYRKAEERDALIRANIMSLFLTSAGLTGRDMQLIVLSNVGHIADLLEKYDPPFIASITQRDVSIVMSGTPRQL